MEKVKKYLKKSTLKILFLVPFIILAACNDMFRFSPYDASVSKTDVNDKNIQRIVNNSKHDDTLHIAAFADSHNYYNDLRDIIRMINRLPKVDFVIAVGDITEKGLAQEYEWYCQEMYKLNTPFITVIGNHDHLSNGITIYTKMFGPRNFFFDYFGYRFVCFNDVVWENANVAPDFDWLSNSLRSKDSSIIPILFAHIQPWTDEQLGEKYSPIYVKIAEDNHVLLSVGGHTHEFQDIERNNVKYHIIGSVKTRSISLIHLNKDEVRIERIKL